MKRITAIALIVAALGSAACGQNTREIAGGGLGAVAGGVLGSQVGKGKGRILATALGAVAGVLAGSAIGRHLDDAARAEAGRAVSHALDTGTIGGRPIQWEAPRTSTSNARGAVHITRQGRSATGELCREYRHAVTIGDSTEEVVGTACRNPQGVWRIIES